MVALPDTSFAFLKDLGILYIIQANGGGTFGCEAYVNH